MTTSTTNERFDRQHSRPTTSAPTAASERATAGAVTNLVWVDAREAIVLRWDRDGASVTRMTSDVPGHHHSTGHVRRDPTPGNGGGGPPRAAGESHRLEHLERFVEAVAAIVPATGDVLVIGPGTVHEHLAERLRKLADRRGLGRSVGCEPSAARTEGQLVARLRDLAGSPPRRRTPRATRRTGTRARLASGALAPVPRREPSRELRGRRPLATAGLDADIDPDADLDPDTDDEPAGDEA